MNQQQLVLVDSVNNCRLEQNRFHNEIGSLHTLYCGLEFLNNQLSHLESIAKSSPNGNVLVGFFSNLESHFNLPPGSNVLIPCFYHWFGVSIVNFVRKVGLLEGILKGDIQPPPYSSKEERREISSYCSSFVRSVPEINPAYVWRNKVFAHFANTDPYDGDNEALLQQASFYPVSYASGKIEVGGFQLFTGNFEPGTVSDPGNMEGMLGSGLPNWAMTDLYQKFVLRFFFEVAPSTIGQ